MLQRAPAPLAVEHAHASLEGGAAGLLRLFCRDGDPLGALAGHVVVAVLAALGLKLLAEGKDINYEGTSGPCDFTDIGDIEGCRFRYMEVVDGKLKFLKIV